MAGTAYPANTRSAAIVRYVRRLPWLIPSLLIVMAVAVACGDGGDGAADPPDPEPSVEVDGPASSATAAATPTGPIATPVEGAYELAQALPSATFGQMLAFSPIPGAENEGVVVTQGGVIHRVPLEGDSPAEVFGDVSDRLISEPDIEEGLLGLAFSPDYQSDRQVYLYYTAGNPRRSVVSRFSVVDGVMDIASERVLLEVPQPFTTHNAGQIVFGPDGYLYIALGDGGNDPVTRINAQRLSTLLGSILRLDVSGSEYAVPPDNPFVATPGARPEIYAYGLRNPWRFSFDRVGGDLWAADVGQGDWEEVDRIVAGGNYGWPVMEGPKCFEAETCDQSSLQMPHVSYTRPAGCSVVGGFVYRGTSMPELYGLYVYGDWCTGNIWAVSTNQDSRPVLLAETRLNISSFGELPDGELLVLTYANAVYRLQGSL